MPVPLRRAVKLLVRLAILLTVVSTLAFVGDLFLDFLPSSLQTRLPMHPEDPVIVDVKIDSCWLTKKCDISSSTWKRIPKDLYLGKSWLRQAYLYYREIPEPQLPQGQEVVVGIATGFFDGEKPGSTLPQLIYDDLVDNVENLLLLNIPSQAISIANKHGWQLRDKQAGLWVKYAKHQPNQAVTKLTILFGEDAEYPLRHWTLADEGLSIGTRDYIPRIAFRKGRTEHKQPSKLRFNESGRFKVVQIADPHMSTGYGRCDNPVPPLEAGEVCHADVRSMEFAESVINKENPDLVVFTGDQVFGMTSPDPETSLLKALAPALKYEIPFAVVWGNHDHQGPLSNMELMNIAAALPNSHASAGPEDVPGESNYYLTVNPHAHDYPALALYFLDTHDRSGMKDNSYDWIRPEQHDFLRASANAVQSKLQGYSHIPLSMAFFHIPIPEFTDGWGGNVDVPRVGEQREGVAGPRYNSGTLDVLRDIGVSVVSVGHDHVNDFCQLQPPKDGEAKQNKLWLCYGGSMGWGAYGGYPVDGHNYERRIRVFDIDMNVPTIDTWHHVQDREKVVNRFCLVENGKATLKYPPKDEQDIKDGSGDAKGAGTNGHHRNSNEKIIVEIGEGNKESVSDEDDEE